MVKILEYKYRSKNDNIHTIETRVFEFKDFGEYLNLQAVGRTGFPKYYKVLERSYDIKKEEVLTFIHDHIEGKSYRLFAKVINNEN